MKNLRNLDQVPRGAPVYVYGAGKAGATLLRALRRQPGVVAAGFIDSFKSGSAEGLPVIALTDFAQNRPADAQVIIASMYVNEIAEQLDQQGVHDFYNGYPLAMALIDQGVLKKNLILIGAVLAVLAAAAAWFLV